jgi:hypothetical protein
MEAAEDPETDKDGTAELRCPPSPAGLFCCHLVQPSPPILVYLKRAWRIGQDPYGGRERCHHPCGCAALSWAVVTCEFEYASQKYGIYMSCNCGTVHSNHCPQPRTSVTFSMGGPRFPNKNSWCSYQPLSAALRQIAPTRLSLSSPVPAHELPRADEPPQIQTS